MNISKFIKNNRAYILFSLVIVGVTVFGLLIYKGETLKKIASYLEKIRISNPEINSRTTKLAQPTDNLFLTYDFIFSPNGREVAYIAWEEEEGSGAEKFVMLNNKKGESYKDIRDLKFSPDSQHLVYIAEKGGKDFVVLDNKEGKHYDYVHSPRFGPNGDLYYTARVGEGWDLNEKRDRVWKGDTFFVINKEEQREGECSYIDFSPNFKHFYCILEKNGKKLFMLDGKLIGSYDSIVSRIEFSNDDERYAYAAVRGNECFIVLDGEENFVFSREDCAKGKNDISCISYFASEIEELNSFYLSSDGKHFAYIKTEVVEKGRDEWGQSITETTRRVFIDGEEKSFPGTCVTFSPDGEHFSYYNYREGPLVVDDERIGVYGNIIEFAFSPNSERFAFLAKNGDRYPLILDGEKVQDHKYFSSSLVFSSDSKHIAYVVATEDSHYAVIQDRKKGKSYEVIETGSITGRGRLFFSPDNQHVIYVVREEGKNMIVIDGKEGQPYDKIFPSTIQFIEKGEKICYGAVIDKEVWWVIQEI